MVTKFLKTCLCQLCRGEANSRSLPSLICQVVLRFRLNADTAQLWPTNLSPRLRHSEVKATARLRSPPVRKDQRSAHTYAPGPFPPRLRLSCRAPCSPWCRPGWRFSPQPGARPPGRSPRDSAFLRCPRPRASRRRAGRLSPSPGDPRAASRAHARPPPLRPSPQAARLPGQRLLAGREPEGLRDAASRPAPAARRAALLREGGSNLGGRSSSGEAEHASSAPPSTRHLLPACSSASARDSPPEMDFFLARGARRSRSTCRRPRSSTGGKSVPEDPLLLYPALISHRPGVLSLCSRARSGATARSRREESRRAAVSTSGCPRPRGRAPCASGNPGEAALRGGPPSFSGAAGEGSWSPHLGSEGAGWLPHRR